MNTLEAHERHRDQHKIFKLEGALKRRRKEMTVAVVETGSLTMKNRPQWGCCLYEAFWVLPSSLLVIFSIVYIHIFYLEKKMATYSSILAWKSPWTEEPGGLQSIGLHDLACMHEGGGR